MPGFSGYAAFHTCHWSKSPWNSLEVGLAVVRHELADDRLIGLAHNLGAAGLTLHLLALVGEHVALIRRIHQDFASAGALEAAFDTAFGFHLGHFQSSLLSGIQPED